jgi:DNA modification methylase
VIADRLAPGVGYYVFGPQGGGLGELLLLLRESGLEARHILIWMKDRPTFSLGRLDYEYQHEPICYGWRLGAAHHWHASEPQSSIIQVDRPAASKLHATMKPVGVYERLIRNSTIRHQLVLDPFAGSGTAAIACQSTGRRAALMEIDPAYCDVICARWQSLTGEKPVRDGEPHDFGA